ncbi:MAG: hypothetical protein KTR32_43385, partial [Granulosicoccus sp.]|nr:hypothetical protein [Granulosicoccus sp.]
MFSRALEPFISIHPGRGCLASALLFLIILAGPSYGARPEPPALLPQTHLVEDGEFLHPYLPAFRTSIDCRELEPFISIHPGRGCLASALLFLIILA